MTTPYKNGGILVVFLSSSKTLPLVIPHGSSTKKKVIPHGNIKKTW
jgi:hypothetical protein